MTLNDLITQRQRLKDERSALALRDSEISRELIEVDNQLLAMLDEQGVNGTAIYSDAGRINVSISEQVVPTVTDWQAVYDYVDATGRFQLFERRMSAAAYRELLANNGSVPGVQPFTKRTINMRRVAS